MGGYQGFGELKTPNDLVQKLRHDLERMENSPHDQYAAFDFFVTAEHIIDWLYPESKDDRKTLRSSEALLRITSHIANGAKHFEAKDTRHRSVGGIEKEYYVESGYVEDGYFQNPLQVSLTSDEAKELGARTVDIVLLARKVLEFWNAYKKQEY